MQRTFHNAMAYMFASNPDKHLANVFLETEFCIACAFHVRALCVCQLGNATPSIDRVCLPVKMQTPA